MHKRGSGRASPGQSNLRRRGRRPDQESPGGEGIDQTSSSPGNKKRSLAGGLASILHRNKYAPPSDEEILSVDPAELDRAGAQGESMERLNQAVNRAGISLSWDTGEKKGVADR